MIVLKTRGFEINLPFLWCHGCVVLCGPLWSSVQQSSCIKTQSCTIPLTWYKLMLQEANKPERRAEHPWIITMGHRPMYCSDTDDDDCTKHGSIVSWTLKEVNTNLFYKYPTLFHEELLMWVFLFKTITYKYVMQSKWVLISDYWMQYVCHQGL